MRKGRLHIGVPTHARRIRALQTGFVLLSLAYGGRLVQLQVFQSREWTRLSLAQNATRVEIPARRGGIHDREGRPLVLDAQEFRAYLAPREMGDPERAIEAAARILGLTRAEADRLRAARSGWVAIPRRLSGSDRERLMGAIRRGIHFEHVSSRTYPEGDLARSLIGTLELSGHGASGLEMQLDSLLRGSPGAALTRRDALGETYWLPDATLSAPRPGHDVFLTLDADLQAIAENALERALTETGASGGDVLLLDPRTGEILALASRRGDGFRRIPAFTDPYEPGSTLKPFLLAALLAEGLAELEDSVDVQRGVYRDGRRVIRDVHPYGVLSVAEVVRYSSNVGAVKLSKRLPPSLHYRYLRDFGFGVPTGIEYPAESGGLLRRPSEWSALSQASLAMGYEVAVTSLQLATAYAALANGGLLVRPYLVKEVRDRRGEVVYRRDPEPLRRVVDEEVSGAVTRVLESVVAEGTATRAAMIALPVAGKTGTARLTTGGRYQRRYAASFVGFTPADDPSLVILTKLEDPQGAYYGGSVAAPISQATLQAALASRGVMVDRRLAVARPGRRGWGVTVPRPESGPFIFAVGQAPAPWPEPEPEPPEAPSAVLPDLRGLPVRSAAARLHELGLGVELHASGRVRGQSPPPGQRVVPGTTVRLE